MVAFPATDAMRHFLFDIDGTLISTGRAGSRALLAAIGEMAGCEEPRSTQFAGRTDGYLIAELLRVNGLEPTEQRVEETRRRYLAELPSQLAACAGCVLPGVDALLSRLEEMPGIAVGLLTGNSEEGARLKLEHYGLWHRFDFGFYGDAHANRNAMSQAAWDALIQQHTELDPGHVVVIGDTHFDIHCADAIGARSLACCTGGYDADELRKAGATWVIEDLSDVDRVMALLFSE